MNTVTLTNGTVARYAVLIPSKGRVDQLVKSLTKMPWLGNTDTYLGIEHGEYQEYNRALYGRNLNTMRIVQYGNPLGSVAVAREYLRSAACARKVYDAYVVTDDNAVHASAEAIATLVRGTLEWRKDRRCIMAGMHNTAIHFDRGKLGKAETRYGISSYPSVAMIFQCYPHWLYEAYQYPEDAYGLDDRHFFLWCLHQGVTDFRVCMDAPFTKARYQPGGQGPVDIRAEKTGLAIARLAMDFPKFVGAQGTLRIPWQLLIKVTQQGGTITANRLAGGAMRKEATLQTTLIRVKRKKSSH